METFTKKAQSPRKLKSKGSYGKIGGGGSSSISKDKLKKWFWDLVGECVLRPMFRLLKIKLPVYVVFLGTIGIVLLSQFAIIYSNHSIFMRLNDVIDAMVPMQSQLIGTSDHGNSLIFSTSHGDLDDDGIPEAVTTPFDIGERAEGVFFFNESIDYRKCTSPESDVPWPLKGSEFAKTNGDHSCGMDSDTDFGKFFRGDLWERKFHPLVKKCPKLAVFGVAFGGNFVKDLDAPHVHSLINATDLLSRHGRCFFIFTTEADIENNKDAIDMHNTGERSFIDPVAIGHLILIPIPAAVLPYKNPRRNVKLLKYVGQYLFRETEIVVWQDAKFFRNDFVSKQPLDYNAMVEKGVCVTAIGLPVHKITVGLENIRRGIEKDGRYNAQYEHHCQTIIAALVGRPNVTDSADNLIRQCDAYLQNVYNHEGSVEIMNLGLIDSAFVVWNHKTEACREFSSTLRCTIADQISCHSDRDQVSIPFALYKTGVSGRYALRKGAELQKVDEEWDPRIHDLDFINAEKKNNAVMFRAVRSSCHWYFSRLGNCRTDLTEGIPTIALLIAGSAKRYVLSGMSDHLIKPLRKQNTKVDYYLMLSVKQGLAYRSSEEYMKYQTYDPIFSEISTEKDSSVVTAYLFEKIRTSVSKAGANVGGIHIQPQPMKLDHVSLRKKQLEAKKSRPKEDSYFRFPTLDLRPEYRRRTAVANRNLFKLYLGLQKLWEKHLLSAETYVGVKYDYVMVLREDAAWLQDFDLQKLIDTNPEADAYVLSCDLREGPAMIAAEYNDYGIVIRRNKAAFIGQYFNQILKADLQKCHDSVISVVPQGTGCNAGMLFHWVMQTHNITVQRVPQSAFPMERLLNLKVNDTEQVCIHRMCQSQESPLMIPDSLKSCHELIG